jgi:hypothetical protein
MVWQNPIADHRPTELARRPDTELPTELVQRDAYRGEEARTRLESGQLDQEVLDS